MTGAVQVNATSGVDMEYILSHSTFAGATGYTDDPWGANQVNANPASTLNCTGLQHQKAY